MLNRCLLPVVLLAGLSSAALAQQHRCQDPPPPPPDCPLEPCELPPSPGPRPVWPCGDLTKEVAGLKELLEELEGLRREVERELQDKHGHAVTAAKIRVGLGVGALFTVPFGVAGFVARGSLATANEIRSRVGDPSTKSASELEQLANDLARAAYDVKQELKAKEAELKECNDTYSDAVDKWSESYEEYRWKLLPAYEECMKRYNDAWLRCQLWYLKTWNNGAYNMNVTWPIPCPK